MTRPLTGRLVILLALGTSVAASCHSGSGLQTLLLVDVIGDRAFQNVDLQVTTYSGAPKTFHGATFSATVPYKLGVYVPNIDAGVLRVAASAIDGGCVVGTGEASAANSPSSTTAVGLLIHSVTCVPMTARDGGGDGPAEHEAGAGGAPGTGGAGAGSGGATGSGGKVGTGGAPGTGGVAGTGGIAGTGGVAGTGGMPGTGGSASLTCLLTWAPE